MAVYRCYSEKRPTFDVEAKGLFDTLVNQLEIKNLTGVRYLCRYDIEGVSDEIYENLRGVIIDK